MAKEAYMPFNLGTPEVIIVLVIVLIVFGAGKLPEIGGAIGKSLKEFRRAKDEFEEPAPPRAQTAAPAQPASASQVAHAAATTAEETTPPPSREPVQTQRS